MDFEEPEERTKDNESIAYIDKLASVAGYKIVLILVNDDGYTNVVDCKTGRHIYYSGETQCRTSQNEFMYDNKAFALRDGINPSHLKKILAGSSNLRRYEVVVASFDCWGKSARKLGGKHGAKFESVRYRGIVHSIDKNSISRNRPENVCEPHFFPRSDNKLFRATGTATTLNRTLMMKSSRRSKSKSPQKLRPACCTSTNSHNNTAKKNTAGNAIAAKKMPQIYGSMVL